MMTMMLTVNATRGGGSSFIVVLYISKNNVDKIKHFDWFFKESFPLVACSGRFEDN